MSNTTPIRKLIVIDSAKRDQGSSNNFSVHIGVQKIVRLSVVSVVIPHSFYNVNTGENVFTIDEFEAVDSAEPINTLQCTITPGYYGSVTDVISEIETTLGNDYTLTFNSKTGKLIIQHQDPSVYLSVNINSKIANQLGFIKQKREAGTTTADRMVDLRVQNIYISFAGSNIPATAITRSNDHSNITYAVPLSSVGFGEILTFNSPSQFLMFNYINPINIDNLNVSLRNGNTEVVSNNDTEWSMTMIVDHLP